MRRARVYVLGTFGYIENVIVKVFMRKEIRIRALFAEIL